MQIRLLRNLLASILVIALVACGGGGGSNSGGGGNLAPQALTPWSGLYDGLNTVYLPYANGAITTASVPTIFAKVGNGSVVEFGMDTGSTGTVLSPEYFSAGINDVLQGLGTITYSSSGIIWSGEVWRTKVSLMSSSTQVVAEALVDVLVVNDQSCQIAARDCTNKPNPTGIHFMGVGFNSGTGFTNPPSVVTAAANNPFTNLTHVNGFPLDTMRSGWILNRQGVYLGMSSQLTQNFAFVKLVQNPDTLNLATPLWQSAPAAIGVNGTIVQGVSLVDTGVGEMFLSPVAANPFPPGKNTIPQGVPIKILFPALTSPQPASYQFLSQVLSGPMAPGSIIVSNITSDLAFVNTGRNFLQGFNYLYDAVSGYVGYGDNGNVDANPYRQIIPTQ